MNAHTARKCLAIALCLTALASTPAHSDSSIAGLNDQGLSLQAEGALDEAVQSFLEAAKQAASSSSNSSTSKNEADRYRLNAVRAMVEAGQRPEAIKLLEQVTGNFPANDADAAPLKLASADLYRRLVNELDASPEYRRRAYRLLESVLQSTQASNAANQSWARGYQASLFEDEARYEEALSLNRQAIHSAQTSPGPGGLYRWEWQHGRLLAALGRGTEAIQAYARASDALDKQRAMLQTQKNSYRDIFQPLYYEFANLLLEEVANAPNDDARQELLRQVQNTLETVKTAEIEDYFQEKCVVADSSDLTGIDQGTAVLYPIILDDRLNLVVSTASELSHITVEVPRSLSLIHI